MLRISVLGELLLAFDDAPGELPAGRRARSLLGLLALERRTHARSELSARFWPGVLEDSARTSLRSALAAVRRALGPEADRHLVVTRDGLSLHEDVWTDAAAFEEHVAAGRLREAAALHRGPVLTGLDDDWVLAARDDWNARVAAVLERLAEEAEAGGDWAQALDLSRKVVALDPLAEDAQRLLIGRLARAGDRPAALAAYTRYADRLRTELRIAPSPATRALVQELRDPDPGVAAPRAPVTAEPARTPAPPTQGTVTLLFTDLVGSTELLVALGDDEAERLRRVHFGLLREVALAHGGQEVKSLGDGLMVAFTSSVDAVACAVGIQQAIDRHNRREGSESLRVRVGLNVGEPIRDEDDFFGTAVVVAKRLCDRAEGGQILAADLVRLLIGARGTFAFRALGELELKGLGRPVATSEVLWEPTGAQGVALPSGLDRDQGDLVGRTDELATLERSWERARGGDFAVVGVAGEPGIGKTRLVTELCRKAHAGGATVLLGHCHEEALAPYAPFVEALRQYVAACPADELGLQLGPRRRVLAKLVPELDPSTSSGAGAVVTDEGDRPALFEAVATLLREAAATRPTVLVLDDVHWADDASLSLLRHVARVSTDVALCVLCTYRHTEVQDDDALSGALAELRRARRLEVVALRGLSTQDVAALLRGRGAELSEDAAAAVAQRTEGNPFFVEELVRATPADGGAMAVPDSVKDLLRRRLRQLADPVRHVLSAAAVLGREFDLPVLERVAGGESEDVLEAIDAALDAHVLVDVPDVVGRFAFAHGLIRETIYEQVSPARRPALHRRAGEALEDLRGSQLDDVVQLAHHFALAGEDARSIDHHLRAADAAARVNATEAAIAQFSAVIATAARLGLEAATDARVRRSLLGRGWMRWLSGEPEAGIADYGRSLEGARAAGDQRMQAEVLDRLAFAEKQFDMELSRRHHDEALAVAEVLGDASLEAQILSRVSLRRTNDLDLAGALEAGERALRLAGETGDDRDRALAIDALKLAALQMGELRQLEELTAELEAVQRRHGDLWYLQWTLLEAAFVPLARAEWDRAAGGLGEALAINARVGDTFGGPLIHDAVCWLERGRGDFATALVEGRTAVTLSPAGVLSAFGGWARATLGWALLDLGAAEQAIAVLEPALEQTTMASVHLRVAGHLAWAYALAGDLHRAAGVVEEAERTFALQRFPEGSAFLFGFGAAAGVARTHLALGRPDRAEALLRPLLVAAGRVGWREAEALLSLVLGQCVADPAPVREALALAARHGLPGVEWEAASVLASMAPAAEAAELRARSAAVVERLADGTGDAELAAGLVRHAQR